MSWKEVAEAFRCTWESVFHSVEKAVEWGLAHGDLTGISSLGVDEVLWHRGYKFLTVVYRIIDARAARSWPSPTRPGAS